MVDGAGNAAALDPTSVPTWTINDNTMGSLLVGSSGFASVFTPSGKLGSVLLTCSIPAVNAQPAIIGQVTLVVGATAATTITLIKTN